MKKIILILISLTLIISCSQNSKRALGLTETMPDEYQVQRNKSLEIPLYYSYKLKVPIKNTVSRSKFSTEEKALLKEIK